MERFDTGEKIEFRKTGGWEGLQGEWISGTFKNESLRCIFITDTAGQVNEYWKHRIEVRRAVEV